LLSGKGPRTKRCKAIGIDKEVEEEENIRKECSGMYPKESIKSL
jgi:hypothetical protein